MNKKIVSEKDGLRLVETTKTIKEATDEFTNELIHTLREMRALKTRELGRVLSAFMKIPICDVSEELKNFQSAREHKVLIALIKLQDTKMLLVEALDDADDSTDAA